MDRRPLLLVGLVAATAASVFAVRRLLADPAMRRRLGLSEGGSQPHYGDEVDTASEDSFPASDPPSFTQPKAAVR